MKKVANLLVLGALIPLSGLTGCSPESADLSHRPEPPKDVRKVIVEKNYGLQGSEATFQQPQFAENRMSVRFEVSKDGKSVNSLKQSDFLPFENGTPVAPFSLASEVEKSNQVADIVFLVDITGTMVELIESAKKRLAEFVKSSRERGYHTRMCIATFGDYTVKKCSRFFDNDPRDKSTEAQVKELLSELAQLHAYRGEGKDPGWPDLDENPMGALVDVADAPWGNDSQRFVILVTDWGFLSSPNNQGTIGALAPTMIQVNEAIKSTQMKVFAVTRTKHVHKGQTLVWDGYNTPFQNQPGIVQSSGGEHFDFDSVLKGKITLNDVLERILERLHTTYTLNYVVDTVPGLNPSLPLEQRKVEVRLQNPQLGQLQNMTVTSSRPSGRPEYQRNYSVAGEQMVPESVEVFVDGQPVPKAEFEAKGDQVVFRQVPKPGSRIRLKYYSSDLKKTVRLQPLLFNWAVDVGSTTVYINGTRAAESDVTFSKDLEGNTTLTLAENVLSASDPYGIIKNQGVNLKIETFR